MDNVDTVFEKKPPQSMEDEQLVLGSMMIDKRICGECLAILDTTDFYNENHRKIFDAITSLYLENGETDMVSVFNYLGREIEAKFIQDLIDSVPDVSVAPFHARQIKDLAKRRLLISECQKTEIRAYTPTGKTEELLNQHIGRVSEIESSYLTETDFVHIREILPEVLERIDKNRKGLVGGIKTGFYDLDNKVGALEPGALTIVGARTSVGKTSFMVSLINKIIDRVAIAGFNLEEKSTALTGRLLSQRSGIPYTKLFYGKLSEQELGQVATASGTMVDNSLYIDDTRGLTALQMKNKLSKLKAKLSCKVVFIDYLQLVDSFRKNGTTNDMVAATVTALKNMAGQLDFHLILLSQLTRASARENREPRISDLRDSGAIEQVADLILLIHREKIEGDGKADLIIAKQRLGPVGKIELTFRADIMKFESTQKGREEEPFWK